MTTLLGTYTIAGLQRGALVRGGASAMDLRGDTRRQYRFYATPDQADAAALGDDWRVTGNDLRTALSSARRRSRRV